MLVLTEVHGLANHFARSQLVPCPKQCISTSGLSLGLQNNSLPSAHATRLVLTPFPHSAEHYNNNECHATVFQKYIHTSSLSWSWEIKLNLVTFEISLLLLHHKNHHTKVILRIQLLNKLITWRTHNFSTDIFTFPIFNGINPTTYYTFEDHSEYSQGAWFPVSVAALQAAISHAFWDSGLLANEQDPPDVIQVTVRFRIPRPHVTEHWNAR